MEPILSLGNIKKSFGKKTVLQGITLDIKENEIIGIIGPSGCGKSTLFKILMGYLQPDSGNVRYKGKPLDKIKILRRKVGYTTQEDSFYQKLTLYENMRYYAYLYDVQPAGGMREHLEHILRKVDLHHAKDRLAENVSGGMRRRLNFAISLIHNPDILILDEPTTGLDPKLVDSFWKIIQEVKKEGKTVIVTSHIFPEIEDNCDRIAILKQGEVADVVQVKSLKGGVFKKFEEVLAR